MKILVYRWKAYNYQDIINNFILLGHEVEEIKQDLLNYDIDEEFASKLEATILAKGFDFVFSVNYFAVISEVCQKLNVLYVSWSCDSPLISMYHNSVFNSVNRIFLFDLARVVEWQEMGLENVYHLPLAVDVERIQRQLKENTFDVCPNNIYKNEISFVGSLYEKNSYDKMKYAMPDYLQGYFEAAMEAQKDLAGINIIDKLLTTDILVQLEDYYKLEKSSEDSFSSLGLIFSTTTLGFKIAQLQRISNLSMLAKKFPVSIYTGSDVSVLPRVEYKGQVDYWSTMPFVFANSKINLNMTIPNIATGIPLRCFDVMGAGGFLISNYQAELPIFFEEDKDVVLYRSPEELEDKCKFYLEHEKIRISIAQNGYQTVANTASYKQRLRELLTKL